MNIEYYCKYPEYNLQLLESKDEWDDEVEVSSNLVILIKVDTEEYNILVVWHQSSVDHSWRLSQ